MSTVAYAGVSQPPHTGLPVAARAFLIQVGAAAATAAAVGTIDSHAPRWNLFAALAAGAIIAQLAATQIRGNQVFHTGLAFTLAGALVLPPRALIVLCLAQHLPDWLRQRYPWYIQTFNIASYTLGALAAWAAYAAILTADGDASSTVRVAAAIAAAGIFVTINHLLLARMLRLARGHDRRATGLFSFDGLLTDATLAATGIGLAVALTYDPAAVVAIAFPLILIQRASIIPELKAQATRDGKTGLLNMRGFSEAADGELARAARFNRPLALIVADVDNLREVNNRHGHLAGDAALTAVADAIRAAIRDYDISARFGGDEFVILLPETDPTEARAVAQRIADQLARLPIRAPRETFHVDVSCGIAARSTTTTTLDELMYKADDAMYAAKRA
jgi:diguanylate cyclase (GGDEF)-like protein